MKQAKSITGGAVVAGQAPNIDRIAWLAAITVAIAPLWVARDLPFQDLPQHLYVLAVLRHLHDAGTVFPHFFELRPQLSPYLGYYWSVDLLARVFPLETANRLFLSAYLAAFPLSIGFLLRSLGRPAWPALLAIPFAYGDSFANGFFNYCAALPLAFLSLGLFVRALTDAPRRGLHAALLALCLLLGFALHPVPLGFLALALPFLLFTTPVPEDAAGGKPSARLWARVPALAGIVPCAILGAVWLVSLTHAPATHELGAVDHGWGPGLTFQYDAFGSNLHNFPLLLANIMQDGSDRLGLDVVLGIACLAIVIRFAKRRLAGSAQQGRWESLRPAGLALIALALYFALPDNIQPVIQYLNPRFSHVAAALAVGFVPRLGPRASRVFLWLAAASSLAIGVPLIRGFIAFDREAQSLHALEKLTAPRAVIMGLMFDDYSRVVQQPVFLHCGATLARACGGIPNYCLGAWRQAPIRFRAEPPPPLPSEWRPDLFDYERQGRAYDHFLVRGADPRNLFGKRLDDELYVAGHAGGFWLVRRRK